MTIEYTTVLRVFSEWKKNLPNGSFTHYDGAKLIMKLREAAMIESSGLPKMAKMTH